MYIHINVYIMYAFISIYINCYIFTLIAFILLTFIQILQFSKNFPTLPFLSNLLFYNKSNICTLLNIYCNGLQQSSSFQDLNLSWCVLFQWLNFWQIEYDVNHSFPGLHFILV